MTISAAGTINTTALIVPDLYVQIVPPQNLVLNGVPTNIVGVVGTAIWGPINTPVIVGSFANYTSRFGTLQARKYDMGTSVATAVQQGAQAFRCVRVTDGTDVAATAPLVSSCLTLTAAYTGTLGNTISASVSAGSKAGTFKITIGLPGRIPEVFDNLSGAGNTFWVAAAAAINGGQGALRGPSQLVIASAGVGATAPAVVAPVTLTGGTDGAAVTMAALVGQDGLTRQGMYALRGAGCSILVLADGDDSTQWTAVAGFALGEGMYAIQTCPAGTSITAALAAKGTAGLDSYSSKLLHGDWIYWNDQVNNTLRLVSPQGFAAGRLANLSPEQSSLNKQLYAVVGTQRCGLPGSGQVATYSTIELQTLFGGGIDVVTNPGAGGLAIWTARLGHNSSSNPATSGDNYTRLTNYIATSLNAGMGQYIGAVINAVLFQRIRATLLSFLQNMLGQGLLGSTDGSLPFGVVCDISNNPDSRTSLGYVQADVQVKYMGINEKFIVNLEGGQTVTVNRQTLPSGQVAA